MKTENFVYGLQARGLHLSLEVSQDGEDRLRLAGHGENVTERIRNYIRSHKAELCTWLAEPRCYACYHAVDMLDQTTWRLDDQGELLCIACYRQRQNPLAEQAEQFAEQVLALGFGALFQPTEIEVIHKPTGQVVYNRNTWPS